MKISPIFSTNVLFCFGITCCIQFLCLLRCCLWQFLCLSMSFHDLWKGPFWRAPVRCFAACLSVWVCPMFSCDEHGVMHFHEEHQRVRCYFLHWVRDYMIATWITPGDVNLDDSFVKFLFFLFIFCWTEESYRVQPTLKGREIKLYLLEGGVRTTTVINTYFGGDFLRLFNCHVSH